MTTWKGYVDVDRGNVTHECGEHRSLKAAERAVRSKARSERRRGAKVHRQWVTRMEGGRPAGRSDVR